ncbi:hypothetical protein [Providencia sneebia]|uniref:Uncharacterized protein n=1 Tax=Providencia sneebia DSM 19967 TaxID=1141660 RepID=K8WH60_9GAMM|nr:hypothetical protein [Providencia sneebia]EKT59883.1 hypothetical protein OO7_03594 [Providencia sneebia DSM 19967]
MSDDEIIHDVMLVSATSEKAKPIRPFEQVKDNVVDWDIYTNAVDDDTGNSIFYIDFYDNTDEKISVGKFLPEEYAIFQQQNPQLNLPELNQVEKDLPDTGFISKRDSEIQKGSSLSANGNTQGIVTNQAKPSSGSVKNANPLVSLQTPTEKKILTQHSASLLSAKEIDNVRQWAEERKQDLTEWAQEEQQNFNQWVTQVEHEVSAAIDSPFEGLAGGLKNQWNTIPDLLDIIHTGAQIIEITGSVLGSKIAGLFSDKWKRGMEEHAQFVQDQVGKSAFDFIRFNKLSDAEKGGAFLMSIIPTGWLKQSAGIIKQNITKKPLNQVKTRAEQLNRERP